MSEITLGAIIAGLSALVGALIGGGIASINNWIQIKHQREDALISRRIKARESYLVPLRAALSNYLNNSIKGITAYTVLKEMERKQFKLEDRLTAFKTMEASLDSGTQIIEQIENFAGQSPDIELRKMLLELKNQQGEIEMIVKRNSKWLANIAEINPKEWSAMRKQYDSVLSNQRDRLIPINRRIEELLSGVS